MLDYIAEKKRSYHSPQTIPVGACIPRTHERKEHHILLCQRANQVQKRKYEESDREMSKMSHNVFTKEELPIVNIVDFWSCHHKVQNGWLRTTENSCLTLLEATSPENCEGQTCCMPLSQLSVVRWQSSLFLGFCFCSYSDVWLYLHMEFSLCARLYPDPLLV